MGIGIVVEGKVPWTGMDEKVRGEILKLLALARHETMSSGGVLE